MMIISIGKRVTTVNCNYTIYTVAPGKARCNSRRSPECAIETMAFVTEVPMLAPMMGWRCELTGHQLPPSQPRGWYWRRTVPRPLPRCQHPGSSNQSATSSESRMSGLLSDAELVADWFEWWKGHHKDCELPVSLLLCFSHCDQAENLQRSQVRAIC